MVMIGAAKVACWSSLVFAVIFLPLGAILLLWPAAVGLLIFRRRRGKGRLLKWLSDRFIKAIALILFLCYPSMSRNLLSTEVHVYIPTNTPPQGKNYWPHATNETWLRVDGTVRADANDPTFQWLRPMSTVLFFIVAFGLPMLVPVLLLRFRWPVNRLHTFDEEGRPEASRVGVGSMAFIYEKYTPDWWFFESLEMIRKLLLSAAIGGVNLGEDVGDVGRLLLGAAFSAVFAVGFLTLTPYVFDASNRIQGVAHLCLAFLYVDGAVLLLEANPFGDNYCSLRRFRTVIVLAPVVYAVVESLPIKPSVWVPHVVRCIRRRIGRAADATRKGNSNLAAVTASLAYPDDDHKGVLKEALRRKEAEGRRGLIISRMAHQFLRAIQRRMRLCEERFATHGWDADLLERIGQDLINEVAGLEAEYTARFYTTWNRLQHLEDLVNRLLMVCEEGPGGGGGGAGAAALRGPGRPAAIIPEEAKKDDVVQVRESSRRLPAAVPREEEFGGIELTEQLTNSVRLVLEEKAAIGDAELDEGDLGEHSDTSSLSMVDGPCTTALHVAQARDQPQEQKHASLSMVDGYNRLQYRTVGCTS